MIPSHEAPNRKEKTKGRVIKNRVNPHKAIPRGRSKGENTTVTHIVSMIPSNQAPATKEKYK